MKKSTKIVLGSVAGLVLIGGISSAASGGGDEKTASPAVVSTEKPSDEKTDKPAKKEKKAETPIKLSGVVVPFKAGPLSDGGKHTAVKITLVNDSDDSVSVNPLYFTITDTNGTKHPTELGEMSDTLHHIEVAPGENVSGVITGKGDFQPKYVTFTENGFGEALRGNVK